MGQDLELQRVKGLLEEGISFVELAADAAGTGLNSEEVEWLVSVC